LTRWSLPKRWKGASRLQEVALVVYDVRDLVKVYPGQTQPANKDITLQIQQGEIFGLLGDNGAGKTTLVRQMVNLLRSTSGSVTLYGTPIEGDPLHVPTTVGYMPQETHSLNTLTVGEALYFTAHLRGLSRLQARRERDALLDLWQIGDIRDRDNSRLSGGQRRLLRLAVAMAGSPPVLILDEPTNDLDPMRRRLVWDVLRRINHEQGTTIIFITHDAIEAEKVIERVGIMRNGELVAVGRPSDLKQAIDRKLRLELFFSPDTPPGLPPELPVRRLQPGRWLVLLEWAEATTILELLDMEQIDDFRLYSATLEDLYAHYASRTGQDAVEMAR
jgi:ABC-2 type transport system ATP-binding protein